MAAPPPPPPPKGGLSLYDNLVDPNDPAPAATISSAPVLYNQNDPNTPGAAPAKKPIDPAFRFQPVRRPQPKLQKPKATFPKAIPKAPAPAAAAAPEAAVPPPPQPAATKSTLADWAATEEDEWRYGVGEKRQRGGRKKKKKQQQQHFETDWDDIYDPARPTNVEEYLRSDEKIDEVREWKALLYAHRKSRQHSDTSDDDDGRDSRPTSEQYHSVLKFMYRQLTLQNKINSPLLHHTASSHLHHNHHHQPPQNHHDHHQTTAPAKTPTRAVSPSQTNNLLHHLRLQPTLHLPTRPPQYPALPFATPSQNHPYHLPTTLPHQPSPPPTTITTPMKTTHRNRAPTARAKPASPTAS